MESELDFKYLGDFIFWTLYYFVWISPDSDPNWISTYYDSHSRRIPVYYFDKSTIVSFKTPSS
jgi:hypothetical protein